MSSSPIRIDEFAADLANIVDRLDKDPEALEMLTQQLDDPKFPKLLTKFQKIMYSHVILRMITKEDYVKASKYLSAVSKIPGDDFREHFEKLRMMTFVRGKMLQISSIPLFEKGSPENIIQECESLMKVITTSDSEKDFRQALGIIHYNLAISLALQKNISMAIEKLKTAQDILSEPIDRIVRARVKCGFGFLTNTDPERCPSPSNFASELTVEERATPDFANEIRKWVSVSRVLLGRSSSPSPE
jgi:hypothetical protein